MAEKDCDTVHCPTVGNKHWMFDPRLKEVVNQFAYFQFGGALDSILRITDQEIIIAVVVFIVINNDSNRPDNKTNNRNKYLRTK